MNTATATSKPATKKFQIHSAPAKPLLDPATVEEFAKGVDNAQPLGTAPAQPAASPEAVGKGGGETVPASPLQVPQAKLSTPPNVLSVDKTKHFTVRLLPEQFDRLEMVFAMTTFKSKQKLGEHLFIEGLEKLAKELGI